MTGPPASRRPPPRRAPDSLPPMDYSPAAPGCAAHLFGLLRGLGLPAGDYAVFGSGPLLVRGIIARAGDLDVICRGAAWEAAQRLKACKEARELFGTDFVDHFAATREWEEREFRKHISDWELDRYFEII